MDTFGQRLVASREKYNLSQKELAERLGITPTRLNYWEKDKREPAIEMIKSIAQALDVDTNYLIGYQPQKKTAPSMSNEAMRLAQAYDDLDSHGKRVLRLLADEELNRCKEMLKMETAAEIAGDMMDNIIPFRRSYQPASAGTGMYLGPDEFETIYVQENDLTRRASFGVPVSGDSMEPDYHDGDVLLVERAEDIKVGEVGVFTINGEGYVKERGDGELISLNSVYDPIPMNESIFCSGRVIGVLEPDWIVER